MTPSYRFFPWVRRGLAAALPPAASALPVRGLARVKVTVTPELVAQREVSLLGPGDVLGLDQRLIVRTEPRANAHDFEPNYLASIDFDAPELPWLFTPAGAPADNKLVPWVVLVVLDRDVVAAPRVVRNRPLPFVELPGSTADTELPDLSDAWAWAHVQRTVASDDSGDDARELAETPDLNVSRLIAPRRLAPNRRWLACVMPTFDAGVAAGLGVPRADPAAPLAPAWTVGRRDVELPVYFHWEFDTGTAGDFEYLARRLKPVIASARARSEDAARHARVYLGDADDHPDTRAALPPEAASSALRLDAPLEMIDQPPATPDEAPAAFCDAVARAANPAATADEVLRPPLYGTRHAKRDRVDPAQRAARWFDELNLDPRTRIAAREGGDAVRRFQEDLMEAAWQQVGDVLAANMQLARSRFLALVAQRALERHVVGLPAPRVLALAAPLHARLRDDALTVSTRIGRTSLANTAFEPALRRLVNPGSRLARRVARAAPAGERVTLRHALARGIAEALQRDELAVDPSLGARDGIERFELGVRVAREQPVVPGQLWSSGQEAAAPTFDAAVLSRPAEAELSWQPRPDLAVVGVLGDEHFDAAARIAHDTGVAVARIEAQLRDAVVAAPNALRYALRRDAEPSASRIVAVEGKPDGSVVLADPATGVRTKLFALDAAELADAAVLDAALQRAPTALLAAGAHRANVVRDAAGPRIAFELQRTTAAGAVADLAMRPGVRIGPGTAAASAPQRGKIHLRPGIDVSRPGGGLVRPRPAGAGDAVAVDVVHIEPHVDLRVDERLFAGVIPAPHRGAVAVQAARIAIGRLADAQPPQVRPMQFLRANLGDSDAGLAARVRVAIEPSQVFRRRALAMVHVPAWLREPATDVLEPILAAPVLSAAFAELHARVAPARFLPRDVELPDESITALVTNPRHVAAFMLGVNHEFNRELVWRTYPTDGRGTSATRFWNWFDPAQRDIESIHAWPAAGPLAARSGGGVAQVVLVVRGRLLRRYPNTLVLAWKAAARGELADPATAPTRRDVLREPLFKLFLDPDTTLVGFDLSKAEFVTAPEPGWYIVLQEPLTEPRFGLDEPGTPAGRRRSRNDRNWQGSGVAPAGHLAAGNAVLEAPKDAAEMGERLLQRPVRVALHASQIVAFPPDP